MKKALVIKTCVLLVCLLISISLYIFVFSVKTSYFGNLSAKENFTYAIEDKAIYGNFSTMDESTSNIIQNQIKESKHVLLYDLSEKVVSYKNDEPMDEIVATAYSKQNGILYRKTFTTNEKDTNVLLGDIDAFFADFISEVLYEKNKTEEMKNSVFLEDNVGKIINLDSPSETSDFVKFEVDSGECVKKPYGKIVYVTNVYISQPDSFYSIYMVETSTEFVPGVALKQRGDSAYHRYISKQARQNTSIVPVIRFDLLDQEISGEDPNILGYWPTGNLSKTNVSSLFGGQIIGYFDEDGFDRLNTGDFSHPQSQQTTDPSMSATTLTIGEKYGWYFLYDANGTARLEKHHFDSIEVFEMLNGGQFDGQFSIKHELWYRVNPLFGLSAEISFSPSFTVCAIDNQK